MQFMYKAGQITCPTDQLVIAREDAGPGLLPGLYGGISAQ